MKFIMLINVKMPTIVDICKQDEYTIRDCENKNHLFQHSNRLEKWKSCSVELSMNKFCTTGPGCKPRRNDPRHVISNNVVF